RTGDIGFFKIVSETGVAAGIRRLEAVTADGALEFVQSEHRQVQDIAAELKAQPQEAASKFAQVLENSRTLEKDLARLRSKLAASQGEDLADQAVEVRGVRILAATLDNADTKSLRETLDRLK